MPRRTARGSAALAFGLLLLVAGPARSADLLLAQAAPPAAAEENLLELLEDLEDDGWVEDMADPADRDPFEGVNRSIFAFNEGFIGYVLDPVARGYAVVAPAPVRQGIHNFFRNVNAPVVFINDLVQLSPRNAGRTAFRFVFNSTFGILGLVDAGKIVGVSGHHSDFGQTLAVYRVASGPYIVIPFIGPSTLRDGLGELIDFLLRIDTWTLAVGPGLVLYGGDQFTIYDIERERLDALRQTSVDFYAALRGAYLLDREALIRLRREQLGRAQTAPPGAPGGAPVAAALR